MLSFCFLDVMMNCVNFEKNCFYSSSSQIVLCCLKNHFTNVTMYLQFYQEAKTRNVFLAKELDTHQAELDKIRQLSVTAFQRMKDNAVDVTLDDDTANPNLKISSEHTTASCAPGGEIPSDMSRRFVSRLSVLGKEEFTGGRHFWMVEVDSQLRWDLGVARDSVDRKGEPALNPENGYWTIGHDDQRYWANDTSHLEISLQGKLQMIGIYVNYEAGQVLFCNADTRSHLHSFTACFEGPICPFFNLSESGKVSIFQSTSPLKQPNSH
ncbi:butyrophilin subfamily 2 member A2-like [Scyliorhinus canicula]|uniref:butyrophilin subfamily 2 member A2-like n=1 Tax=Scyliorhinus canicula TaxID=7830 RepID=UPI0018F54679|nr:butyrophilin subfamily 2 member A2-like [Scyliorhinus canicula]